MYNAVHGDLFLVTIYQSVRLRKRVIHEIW